MFERIMFFIVLALFALVPAGLVYAQVDTSERFSLDLSNYNVIPNPPKLYRVNNNEAWNTTINNWVPSKSTACGVFFGVAANNVVNNQSWRTESIVGYKISSDGFYCQLNRKRQLLKNDGSNDGNPTYQYLNYPFTEKVNPAQCVNENISLSVGFIKMGHIATPPTKICVANCVLQSTDTSLNSVNHVTSSGGKWPQPDGTKYSSISLYADKRTDQSCELNMCSPDDPLCTQPEEPPAEDCPAAEKTANGGKCQTPDPNGNKCPDSQKTGAGGTCSGSGSGDGDGDGDGSGSCTPEQKAANGGQCPSGGGGTCTSNPVNKKFCDLADWLTGGDDFELPDQETEVPKREITREELPKAQQINFAAGCPAPETFTAFGKTVSLSYDVACDLMRMIKPFVILAANLMALFIFINSIRN